MPYRVAPDSRVVAALSRVLDLHPEVGSQTRLAALVRAELEADDPLLRVSASRVRQLALDSGLVRLEVRTRHTHRAIPPTCPVCATRLKRRRNRTLTGGETVVGARCPRCPYETGPRFEEPTRYTFEPRRRRRAPTGFPVRGRMIR